MHNWRDHDDPTTPAKYTCTKGSTQVTVNSESHLTLTVYSKATESNHEGLSFANPLLSRLLSLPSGASIHCVYLSEFNICC